MVEGVPSWVLVYASLALFSLGAVLLYRAARGSLPADTASSDAVYYTALMVDSGSIRMAPLHDVLVVPVPSSAPPSSPLLLASPSTVGGSTASARFGRRQ